MQSGQKNYYFIQTNSGKALSDFRATIFFKSNLKRLGVLDVIDIYFPVVIDFTIITPPPNQNFTLQAEMTLASDSTSWNPKSTFIGNDRVFVKVSSTSYALLENNHLTVMDAYLCCFKQFVASLPKDTGCLQYNSDTMDVWKKIISSSTTVNAELSTKIHPFSNTNYAFGFSFQISSSLFPEKLSQTASSCFVQAKVGTTTPLSKRNRLEEPSTLQASLFLVDLSQKRSNSSLASSLRRNVVLWNLMSACVVFAVLLFSS
ncbi:hypothetical protein C9374_007193 [Naegleria lovaniensis]|uniref:Uncharacterized protein n=1 Tax=Naegleria lovaniensis TaxID=51637 RepID=A0AA88H702_NAELO|nr:uncharacterized protein C9374_007193 [Naegleria lovaniensis]KAG2393662.1 hypothetical protein C9374_007193 [Naegleria lovaniensis]